MCPKCVCLGLRKITYGGHSEFVREKKITCIGLIFVQVWMHLRMGQIEQQTLIFLKSRGNYFNLFGNFISKNVVIDEVKQKWKKRILYKDISHCFHFPVGKFPNLTLTFLTPCLIEQYTIQKLKELNHGIYIVVSSSDILGINFISNNYVTCMPR